MARFPQIIVANETAFSIIARKHNFVFAEDGQKLRNDRLPKIRLRNPALPFAHKVFSEVDRHHDLRRQAMRHGERHFVRLEIYPQRVFHLQCPVTDQLSTEVEADGGLNVDEIPDPA